MMADLMCPISKERTDRNVVRVNGFITTLALVAYVVTGSPWLIVMLGFDYVLRTMLVGPTSPMTHLARNVAKLLRLPISHPPGACPREGQALSPAGKDCVSLSRYSRALRKRKIKLAREIDR